MQILDDRHNNSPYKPHTWPAARVRGVKTDGAFGRLLLPQLAGTTTEPWLTLRYNEVPTAGTPFSMVDKGPIVSCVLPVFHYEPIDRSSILPEILLSREATLTK